MYIHIYIITCILLHFAAHSYITLSWLNDAALYMKQRVTHSWLNDAALWHEVSSIYIWNIYIYIYIRTPICCSLHVTRLLLHIHVHFFQSNLCIKRDGFQLKRQTHLVRHSYLNWACLRVYLNWACLRRVYLKWSCSFTAGWFELGVFTACLFELGV